MTSQSNESLLKAIIDVQNMVINHDEPSSVFESMLGKIIEITGSLFGFMGEVFYSSEKKPFLKTYALTNIAWNDETRALYETHLSTGLEFHNLDTLFGAALKTGEPVISNDPSHDQRSAGLPAGHPALTSFLCLPVKTGEKLIGLIGLANKPEGYTQADVEFLAPLLKTFSIFINTLRNRGEIGRLSKELRINRDAWDALFENSENLVTILSPDHRILRANQATQVKTGLTAEALTGRKCYEVFHGTLEPPADCPLEKICRDNKRSRVLPMPLESLAGTFMVSCTPLFNEQGDIERVIHVATDINQIKEAERKSQASEKKFRTYFDHSSVGMAVVDLEGHIMECNAALANFLGYSKEELCTKTVDEITHPDDREVERDHKARQARDGYETFQLKKRYRRADGSEVHGLLNVSLLRDESGSPGVYLGQVVNITSQTKELQFRQAIIATRADILEYALSHSLEELMTFVLDKIGELVDSPIGFYHFVSEDEKTLSLQAWSSRTLKEFCRAEGSFLHYPTEQAGVWADALRLRQPVVHNDYESLADRKGLPPGHARVVRELVVPVFRNDKVVAILGVGNKPSDYTEKDVALVSYLADVTWAAIERIRFEKQLLQSREENSFLAELLYKAPVIAAFHDRELNTMWANRSYEEATGKTLAQMRGKKCYEVWNLSKPCRKCPVVEAVTTGISCQTELTPQNQDHWPESQGYWLCRAAPVSNEKGEIIGAIETAIDITANKKAEQDLLRLRTAIQQIHEAIVMTDPQGVINYVNNAFTDLTGYSAEEAIGNTPAILKSGRQDKAFYLKMWSALKSGRIFEGQLINRRKDGSFYTEEMTITPVVNSAQKIINYVAIKKDITEQLALTQLLRQAQKMDAIGTLAGGIAHDFNNILSSIMGYTELAMAGLDQPAKARDDLEHVLVAGKRAVDLVGQILTVARKTEKNKQPLRLQSIVKEVLKLLQPSISSNFDIKINLDTDTPEILADAGEIHQMIMNLCINASHAMHAIKRKNHRLEITLGAVKLDADEVRLYALPGAPGRFVRLTVSDTGCGMDETTQQKIFDPYFTTKAKGKGTGLGLATVDAIIKTLGGAATVASQVGVGTSFTVYLPVYDGKIPSRNHSGVVDIKGGTERIMVIDDEKPIAELLRRQLSSRGYRVSVYTDCEKAMQAFMGDPSSYDIVITDMNMPKLLGTDLARDMREVRNDLPIILCTGFLENTDLESARALNVSDILYKPVEIGRLLESIRKVLGKNDKK